MTAHPDVILALIAGVLVPLVAVLIAWLRRRLRLDDSTADAVAGVRPDQRPTSVDQALTVLAKRVNEQGDALSHLRIYVPLLDGWGERGWAKVPEAEREAKPKPPMGLHIDITGVPYNE